MRLDEYARSMCGCGCGLPYAVSHDPKQPFVVDSQVCYAQRQLTKVREKETKAHESDPKSWSVGRHHFVYVPSEEEVERMLRSREEAAE